MLWIKIKLACTYVLLQIKACNSQQCMFRKYFYPDVLWRANSFHLVQFPQRIDKLSVIYSCLRLCHFHGYYPENSLQRNFDTAQKIGCATEWVPLNHYHTIFSPPINLISIILLSFSPLNTAALLLATTRRGRRRLATTPTGVGAARHDGGGVVHRGGDRRWHHARLLVHLPLPRRAPLLLLQRRPPLASPGKPPLHLSPHPRRRWAQWRYSKNSRRRWWRWTRRRPEMKKMEVGLFWWRRRRRVYLVGV